MIIWRRRRRQTNNDVTDRVVVLVNNLRGLSEHKLGGVLVAAVGRAPESRSCAYFLALSWFVESVHNSQMLPGVGVNLACLSIVRPNSSALIASHPLPSNPALVIGRGLYPGEHCTADNVARRSPKETPY
ncbi:hypothetical protein M405DRAFT_121653 [Rhizopogon salebrosus TDB-379]|nr:hypothetical protein M405DRAFT_121653 [Rhizopogon salebrosus TDB-379]